MFDETFAEAWSARYGTEPPASAPPTPFLNHRSVRKYSDKPITDGTMASLIGAAQSAATSSNLQLWTVISMDSPEVRARAFELSGRQAQVQSASRFVGFFADHHRLRAAAARHGLSAEGLDFTEFLVMAIADASLAAERFVCAAESLGIGICYIGGLRNDPVGLKELLGLPDGVVGLFGITLGYPAEPLTASIKPRLSQAAVWHQDRYDFTDRSEEYDARMTAFYGEQSMGGDQTWSLRSAQRVDGSEGSLTGRRIWKAWLEQQGMARR